VLSINEVAVVINTVLLESDLPDLLLARDRVNTMYLCSLAKVDREGFLFLAVEISSSRLGDFRSGKVDLRTVLVEPEMGTHFTGRSPAERPESLTLAALTTEVPEQWLPEAGFLLTVFESKGVSDDFVINEAQARNSPVIVCTLNPPESRGAEAKVNADSLADYIAHFQSLVRHATKDSLRGLNRKRRKEILARDFFSLSVYAFSPGSFNIHFGANDQADLFGLSRVGQALRRIDALMDLAKKPAEEARAGFRDNPGHAVAAYEALLKFATKAQTPFSYRWSDPGMTSPGGNTISTIQAAAMVAILEHEEALKSEAFEFSGYFTSVNTDKKPWSWTARDDDGHIKRGYLDAKAPAVLDGVRIKTQTYKFEGQDSLVQPTSGRLTHKLFLSSVAEI
jgi:hypothetical protein